MTKDRIVLLDSFRGLAVLGILLCNIPDFAAAPAWAESYLNWPHGHGPASTAVWYVNQVVFQQRFYSLFSMLFGVSIFLVGGDGSDRERTIILLKRLVCLLAIGLIHGFAIWWGDILSTYAVVGLVVLLARSWSAQWLLRIGIGLHLTMSAWSACRIFGQMAKPEPPSAPPPAMLAAAKADTVRYAGSFGESLAQNAKDYWDFIAHQAWPHPVLLLITASLMLIGMGLHKLGLFSGKAPKAVYQGLTVAGLVLLAILAFVFAAYLIVPTHPRVLRMSGYWIQGFVAPVISLAYVGALVLAGRAKVWRAIPAVLAPVGQMAFTNYLTQSLMMTALFYGGRGPGLFGSLDRPALAAIVVAVWVLQIVWSRLWMERFTMGPLEWLWRRVYRGAVPLRRASGDRAPSLEPSAAP